MKTLLFAVTIKDCEVQTFRSGGKGGQNQNKVESGVRIIHTASGARGEARDSRDQLINKRAAFVRMTETEEFKRWHNLEVKKRVGGVEEKTDTQYKGFGSKSIRRYVLSGKRYIKDERTGHVRTDVDNVMNGDIDSFIQAYL